MRLAPHADGPRDSHVQNSLCRRPSAAQKLHTDSADPWLVFRDLSPRRSLRVDEDLRHVYTARSLPEMAPTRPYAIYLATAAGAFRWLCFDLDAGRAGPDAVADDLTRLCRWLDAAAVRYVVAASGSPAGRHVWAYVADGVDAAAVAELARALRAVLPSLDAGMLFNPRTGAARPPGSPHRSGTASRLDPAHHRDPAAALTRLRVGNLPEVVELVLAVLPPAARAAASRHATGPVTSPNTSLDAGEPAAGAKSAGPGRKLRAVVEDAGTPRLAGNRRALSPAIAELVATRPANGDYSGHAWRILIGAALARWNREQVGALVRDPASIGLEHLRSLVNSGPVPGRRPYTAREAADILARQWARAVAAAAQLPAGAAPDAEYIDETVLAVTEAVAAAEAAAEAATWRWVIPGGEADREALRALCQTTLAACRLTVALDVRRWANATGHAASTMAAAARRLARTDLVDGPAWIALDTPASGTLAATWTLTPPSGIVAGQTPQSQPAPQAESGSVDKGRTQGGPPPAPPIPTRDVLLKKITADLRLAAHDLWHPHRGLGHTTARTYAALTTTHQTLAELAASTGYSTTTVARHLQRLDSVGLVDAHRPGRSRGQRRLDHVRLSLPDIGHYHRDQRRCGGPARPPDPDVRAAQLIELDRAAAQLGPTGPAGAGAARHRRHAVDRELAAWWAAEQQWRSAPRNKKPRLPRGPAPQQSALVPIAAGPLATYGRFPVRDTGRADYTTAAQRVRAQFDLRLEHQQNPPDRRGRRGQRRGQQGAGAGVSATAA